MPNPIEDVYLQLKNVYPSIRCGIDDIVDVLFVARLVIIKIFSYSQKHDKVEVMNLNIDFQYLNTVKNVAIFGSSGAIGNAFVNHCLTLSSINIAFQDLPSRFQFKNNTFNF